MRAAVLHEHGAAPVVEDHPDPAPGLEHVVVRVTAAPLYPLDLLYASGKTYLGAPALPYVPGVQGVGVDPDGRRVWFATGAGTGPDGSYAEQCAVPANRTVALPDGIDDALAAALGLSSVAAAGALARADVAPGDTVAVLGASGVVGRIAVQLATSSPAGRVVAVVRSPAAAAAVSALGADAVVELGEDPGEDTAARLREAGGGRLDVVIDPLWGRPAEVAFAALSPRGRLVNFGESAGPSVSLGSAAMRSREVEVRGYTNLGLTWRTQADLLTSVFEQAAHGRLTLPYQEVPLEQATDAWQRQATGSSGTRLVLRP